MPDRRPRIVAGVLLALTVVLVAGAGALDVLAEPTAAPTPEPVAVEAPGEGMLHCPVTAGEDGTVRLVVAPAGEEPSVVTILRYEEEAPPVQDEVVTLEPGEVHVAALEGDAAQQPAGVRWEGGPAVATWLLADGTAGAPCEAGTLPRWYVAGFDTTAENDATLHLFNPYAIDAVVRVTFGTPSGPVALVLTDNVLVPARSGVRLDLNEYEPEQPDLAATVEVLTGRVVAQGELSMSPTEHQPGPAGRTLLPGVRAPALSWAFGSGRVTADEAVWIAVHNPGDRDAAVELRVSDPYPDSEALGREFLVPAGSTSRIELTDVSEQDGYGVVLESVNDVPVVATRFVHAEGEDGEDVAVSGGASPHPDWAVAGARSRNRDGRLALYNPGSELVTARVDAGQGSPAEWDALEIGPNQHLVLDLSDAGERRVLPLRVDADGALAADLRVRVPGDEVALWSSALVPATEWEGPGWRPPARRDPTLATSPVVPPVEEAPGLPAD